MVYDVRMAGDYDRGRRLRAADVEAWMAASRRYLPEPGGVVLDLGAGTGRFAGALAAATGATVIACEPSGAMRDVCRRSCPDIPVVGGEARALPFRDGAIGAVWASQMIHHVGDLPGFAAEVRRVLRPGGHLLLRGGFGPPSSLPLHRYFPDAWAEDAAVSLPLAEVAAVLAAAGLARVAATQVEQVLAESREEFVARARSRTLSNLAGLDDASFERGLRAMRRDADDGSMPERIVERLDLVVFGR